MGKQSAGILVYRFHAGQHQVLLVHPGGPFYAKKDSGVWSIPKGEYSDEEDPQEVARREFEEETGNVVTGKKMAPLSAVTSKGGKILYVWATEDNFDQAFIRSNAFDLEWPPHSGKTKSFPEVDRADWFTLEQARERIFPYQIPIIDELERMLMGQCH